MEMLFSNKYPHVPETKTADMGRKPRTVARNRRNKEEGIMRKNINGIPPVVAILLTLALIGLAVWMFIIPIIPLGIIFALIAVDFAADAVLSFKKV